MRVGRHPWYGALISLGLLGAFGVTGSPYYLIGSGPVVGIGRPVPASWSVTTVRVRRATWFAWLRAEMSGARTARAGGASPAGAMAQAMDTSQTYAGLVAAQLAAGRPPLATAGLQVTGGDGPVLRPGDVLLATGAGRTPTPLRTRADAETATARAGVVSVLVVPRTSGTSWGAAELRRVPVGELSTARLSPAVAVVARPLDEVRGPSAGLLLALARIDALTPGDLTGGRRVTGTGAIGLDGTVTGVGEVAEKVRAVASRDDVFFVPALQRAEAERAARGTRIRIVPVRSVSEALAWLCATGGRSPACDAAR